MAIQSDFFFERISDFWENLRSADRDILRALWDGMLKAASDIQAEAVQTGLAKSLRTVPIFVKTIFVPFVFDKDTLNTTATPPSGFDIEAHNIDDRIQSIPSLLDASVNDPLFTEPTEFTEEEDYTIRDGVIFWSTDAPSFCLAPRVLEDRRIIEENFGAPIGLEGESSASFLSSVRAAWFALWSGPTVDNVALITAVPLGLPFSEPGEVISVVDDGNGGSDVRIRQKIDGQIVTVNVPAGLVANVSGGDTIETFQVLSDGVTVSDLITDPGFAERFGLHPLKDLHTFIPVIDSEVIIALSEAGAALDFDVASNLLERLKPAYADFQIGIDRQEDDEADIVLWTSDDVIEFDATATYNQNYVNWMRIPDFESDPNNLDEATYSGLTTERRSYDVGEDTIALRDRFLVIDSDDGTFLAGDDPPVGYGINYGASYGG